jgi:hypothetical protein
VSGARAALLGLLLALGVAGLLLGAILFCRRDLPAPL